MALRAVSRLSRSPAALDLRSVLAGRGFRRLFATRLISQAGDGLYTAGFGAYVFFSATTYPNPAAAASAFAVLYLPYSLIGPFAGVFIDRWSRRQILLVSALVRAGLVAVTALLVLSGQLGVPLYVSALAALGVNRFFLASLSAALPHVVPGDKLVMANSVAPTVGGIVTSIAGIIGVGLRLVLGGGHGSAAVIVLAAGVCYLLAGLTAATMRHDLLGPVQEADQAPEPLSRALREVVHGLAAGVAYLTRRRGPAAAIGAIGGYRVLYGIAFLMSILLYRNYFYPAGNGNAALGHFTLVVIVSAVGYGLAAVISPPVTRRIAKESWITLLLACSGAVAVLGATFSQPCVPRPRVRSRPHRAGDRDLGHHDHPGADRRRLPGPGVRPVRHDVQRGVRPRGDHRRGVHPGRRQVLSAHRGHRRPGRRGIRRLYRRTRVRR